MSVESESAVRAWQYHCARVVQLVLDGESHSYDTPTAVPEQLRRATEESQLGEHLRNLVELQSKNNNQQTGFLASLAVRFFVANGMLNRFPLEKSPHEKGLSTEDQLKHLRGLSLWRSPSLDGSSGTEGKNSLHIANKEEMANVIQEFFRTGIRCQWFEKMLLEALIGAETYALGESLKSNPRLSGRNSLALSIVVQYVYDLSKGKSPKYEVYLSWARFGLATLKISAVLGFLWYSAYLIDADKAFRGYALGLIATLIGVNMVGRFITATLVKWIRHATGDELNAMAGFKVLSLWADAKIVYEQIAHANMNPRHVRSLLRSCCKRKFAIDPIVFALLDRAVAAGEHRWQPHYELPLGLDYDYYDYSSENSDDEYGDDD